ncbi:hypothetical protein [Thalassomonas sp. RHCl1]|uniref:hypothetical protein n=1 Tax=Thalassomonas sp. RHCl1 TaxID=2995320 RepID=UPI00248C5C76|nr:hypothetical protein [Thalassomonas sp. RHCl1]
MTLQKYFYLALVSIFINLFSFNSYAGLIVNGDFEDSNESLTGWTLFTEGNAGFLVAKPIAFLTDSGNGAWIIPQGSDALGLTQQVQLSAGNINISLDAYIHKANRSQSDVAGIVEIIVNGEVIASKDFGTVGLNETVSHVFSADTFIATDGLYDVGFRMHSYGKNTRLFDDFTITGSSSGANVPQPSSSSIFILALMMLIFAAAKRSKRI